MQSARPYRGSDKGWIERLFRTMRERLLESLPGYTGPNVLARGKDIEADAVYFTHELEAIIGRWIAVDYQRRPHDGLRVPEAPHLTLSPNEAYEEAVARAGFLYVPRDPDLHLRLLPVEARVIGRAGVEIAGLTYDSPALDAYRQQRCPLAALDGKWPIRVDPRDLGRVWFQDPRDERFHELPWRHAREVARPFGGSALELCEAAAGRVRDAPSERGGDRHRPRAAAARALRRGSVPRSSGASRSGPAGGDRRTAPRPDQAAGEADSAGAAHAAGCVGRDRDPNAWSSSGDRLWRGTLAAPDGQGGLAAVRR